MRHAPIDRRTFLQAGIATTCACGALADLLRPTTAQLKQVQGPYPPAASIIPVVGDGKWIWTVPPTETGYLEPRDYELKIGIQLEGTGSAGQLKATTPVPVGFPEQSIRSTRVQVK